MPSASDQKRAAPWRSSVRQSMMKPARRLLCMAYLTSARGDLQFHVDVAARVFGGVRVDRTPESQPFVEAQGIVELRVGMAEDRSLALVRDASGYGHGGHS